jgi:hypothetical protein
VTCVRLKAIVANTPTDILIRYWPMLTTVIEFYANIMPAIQRKKPRPPLGPTQLSVE